MSRILIVGAGVFGLTAALELRARGWEVDVALAQSRRERSGPGCIGDRAEFAAAV
jgi:glycine/D-amino acid oxidase-like deaminating enzyme